MTLKSPFLGALLLAASALVSTTGGCELVAMVDRTRIDMSGSGGGGVGGATSSSATTSTGGTGGMAPVCSAGVMTCMLPAACPDPGNECKQRLCDAMGCCGTQDAADGTPLAAQVAGNCKKEVCTGGMPDTTQADDTDVPASQGECNTGACDASHMPVQTPKASGAACTTGGAVCDGAGNCVACVADAQCAGSTSGKTTCDQNHCVTPFCVDGTQDHGETDTDCGNGAVTGCNPCADGLKCAAGADCTSKICDGTMHCAVPACTDGVQNGAETDQDCGGAACDGQGKTCALGKGCAANADCATKYCDTTAMPHVCKTPTCGDGVKNGNETGTDCGGAGFQGAAACPACMVGMGCAAATDCSTGFCNAMSQCATKGPGAACGANGGNSECTSGHCIDGVCCDTACAGLCQACSIAKKGSGSDGVCGPIAAGADPDGECAQDPPSTCGNSGFCDGAGACQKYPSGTTCRPPAGLCDLAETCPGGGAACPADGFQPSTIVCRAAVGACDVAETCTGASATCPANGFAGMGTSCGSFCSGGKLAPDTCDGSGVCSTGTPVACSGNFACADAQSCKTSCGAASPTGDASCAPTFWCDGVGGGACQAEKAAGSACTRDAECQSLTCQSNACAALASCYFYHAANPLLPDGTYIIDPDGSGPIAPFQAYCDMTTSGGGWTLIQSHVLNMSTSATPATSVGLASGTFLVSNVVQYMASVASNVRIEDGTQSVQSSDGYPIGQLQVLKSLDDDAHPDATHWTGTGTSHLSYTLPGTNEPYPTIYHAWNNGAGLHILPGAPTPDFSKHGFDDDTTNLNVWIR